MFVEAYNRYEEFKSISMILHKYRKLFDAHPPTFIFLSHSQFDSTFSPFLLFLARASPSSHEDFVSFTLAPLLVSCAITFVLLSFICSSLLSCSSYHASPAPFLLSLPSYPLPFTHSFQLIKKRGGGGFYLHQLRALSCITPQTLYPLHKFTLALVNNSQ